MEPLRLASEHFRRTRRQDVGHVFFDRLVQGRIAYALGDSHAPPPSTGITPDGRSYRITEGLVRVVGSWAA
jgi:hypothetical protein